MNEWKNILVNWYEINLKKKTLDVCFLDIFSGNKNIQKISDLVKSVNNQAEEALSQIFKTSMSNGINAFIAHRFVPDYWLLQALAAYVTL